MSPAIATDTPPTQVSSDSCGAGSSVTDAPLSQQSPDSCVAGTSGMVVSQHQADSSLVVHDPSSSSLHVQEQSEDIIPVECSSVEAESAQSNSPNYYNQQEYIWMV